jgi:hypothetical protein
MLQKMIKKKTIKIVKNANKKLVSLFKKHTKILVKNPKAKAIKNFGNNFLPLKYPDSFLIILNPSLFVTSNFKDLIQHAF